MTSTTMPNLPFESLGPGQLARMPPAASDDCWLPVPIGTGSRILALRQANPFWFAPSLHEDAKRLGGSDNIGFLLMKERDMWVLWLALPGPTHGAWFESRDGIPGVSISVDHGARADGAPVVYRAEGDEAFKLVEDAVVCLERVMPFHRSRKEKRVPAWLSGLGWCTWDAFYYDVKASDLNDGLNAFAKAGVRLGFVILDDGWQDSDAWRLRSTRANHKFPGGLAEAARRVRAAGVPHLGVWHTLMGYWHGIDPEGALAKQYRISAVPQTTQTFKGWPENHDPGTRYTLHPDDAAAFYNAFYSELAAAGISFTKVDAQAATPYFVSDTFPTAQSFTRYQAAFQGAASVYLRESAIHCMANNPAILWRHATNTVWRNSDDFYPQKPFPAHAEHVYFNAMCALFTRAFAVLDWDMFQSTHAQANLHAATRALSGGPVYVSDRPGMHDAKILGRLVTPFGKVPLFPQPSRPVESMLLQDPRKESVPLMVFNQSAGVGQLCLVNCQSEPSPTSITARWTVGQVMPKAHTRQCVIHDPIGGRTRLVSYDEPIEDLLEASGGTLVWTLSPVFDPGIAPLGHDGLYAAAAAIGEVIPVDARSVAIRFRDPGAMIIWCRVEPAAVKSHGVALGATYDSANCLLRFSVPEGHMHPFIISL